MKQSLKLEVSLKNGLPVLKENGFVVRLLDADNPTEMELFQRLRYRYWVERFKFFKPKAPGEKKLESDAYDEHSVHFGAFNDRADLVAYSRFILPGPNGLQIKNEFEELVHPRVKANFDISRSVESSRLIVEPNLGIKRHYVAQMIYKLKYQYMKLHGFRYWYIVSEKKLIRALRLQKYPFEIIGKGREYYGSVRYPAVMDIDKAESIIKLEEPAYFKWLNKELEDY